MKTLKIKIHSFINLITNSSTEMYMDFSYSLNPIKDLLNKILELSGTNKTCDEVFDIELTEQTEDDPAELIINAKDEEYDELVYRINKFLESIEIVELMN